MLKTNESAAVPVRRKALAIPRQNVHHCITFVLLSHRRMRSAKDGLFG